MSEKEIPDYDKKPIFQPYGEDEDEIEYDLLMDQYNPFEDLKEEELIDQEEQNELEEVPLS